MKKRIVSIVCMAAFAAVVTFGCIGAETAEASQQGTAEGQQGLAVPDIYGPCDTVDFNGNWGAGFEITNMAEEDIYVGLTVMFLDESYECLGIASSYIPCIGSGCDAYIYALNPSVEDYYYFSYSIDYGKSEYQSAATELIDVISASADENHIRFSSANLTNETITMAEVTVVYALDENGQTFAVDSGFMTAGGPYIDLESGDGCYVSIAIPGTYYNYFPYLTAYYLESGYEDIETDYDTGEEDLNYSDYFKSNTPNFIEDFEEADENPEQN